LLLPFFARKPSPRKQASKQSKSLQPFKRIIKLSLSKCKQRKIKIYGCRYCLLALPQLFHLSLSLSPSFVSLSLIAIVCVIRLFVAHSFAAAVDAGN